MVIGGLMVTSINIYKIEKKYNNEICFTHKHIYILFVFI